ncbi:site-specific recombinase XerD [Nitrosospira sp. Nsp2]|uniref:tyrosine-type recombinase/integrase n=1 Tax=Nitrosospira sp. Nsp2 TaxID=136548 RepID=UPI000D2F965F|nr:site-specific integrase [Nitrosospira sp. Nsp2]PTR15078.1 site-specific recombinase XerD [Nitrosospira sp. Nsp2]
MIKPTGKKGTYWCDFRTPDGKRIRQSLHTADWAEAKALEIKLRYDAKATTDRIRKGGITLSEAFQHALRVRDSWRSAKSLGSIEAIYNQVVAHFGAKRPLSKITDELLLQYGEKLKRQRKTPSTINKRLSLVSVLFDEAIKWKKYSGEKPKLIRYRVKNDRRRLITPEEEAWAVSLCIQSSPYEAAMAELIIVLADTGLRLSEALRILPRNLDIHNRTVLVMDTKSGDDRVVPLTGRALAILQRRNTTPVFWPLNAHVVSHIWRRIRKKMGLEHDKEFVLHAFRHTYGSTLANAGTDSFRLQKVMGHKSILSTQRYIKVSASALSGLSSIIEARTATFKHHVLPEDKQEETPKG